MAVCTDVARPRCGGVGWLRLKIDHTDRDGRADVDTTRYTEPRRAPIDVPQDNVGVRSQEGVHVPARLTGQDIAYRLERVVLAQLPSAGQGSAARPAADGTK
eukprot:gene6684-biopygen13796